MLCSETYAAPCIIDGACNSLHMPRSTTFVVLLLAYRVLDAGISEVGLLGVDAGLSAFRDDRYINMSEMNSCLKIVLWYNTW